MKIRTTRNYSEFVADATNRPITVRDEAKMRLLRAAMKKYGFLPFPILVRRSGARLRIIDGQHRFAVAQELGLPVLWVETDRDDIVIAETAAAQSPWSLFHYVASYAARGNEEYRKLMEFQVETGIPLSQASSLLAGEAAHSGNVNKLLREGFFKVKDMKYAQRVAAILGVLKRYVPWAMNSLSIAAISRFARVKEFDDAQMIKRIETHPHMLRLCPTLEMFSDMYESVYNHLSRSRLPLAFMAREAMANRSPAKPKKHRTAAAA